MAQLTPPPNRIPNRNGTGIVFALIFAVLSLLAVYALRIASIQSGVSDKMEHITTINAFTEHPMPLRTTYTGFAPVDKGLSFLVAAFMNGASGWDMGFFVFMIYFLISFFAILVIWAVESCRERNRGALTRFTYIYALFYQTVGGAIIIPIYFLAYLYDTSDNSYWSRPRRLPLNYAKAILPAAIIGYLIPTILICLPYSAPDMWTTQAMVALWQPSPWYVDTLIWVFSKFTSSTSSTIPQAPQKGKNTDLTYLARFTGIYGVSLFVTTLTHYFLLLIIFFSPDPQHRWQYMFLHPTSHSSTIQMTMVQGIHAIFQADFWIIFVAALVWAFLAVYDLKRVGLADVSLWTAGAWILAGTVVNGPGSVVTAVWWWREDKLAKAEEGKGKKEI